MIPLPSLPSTLVWGSVAAALLLYLSRFMHHLSTLSNPSTALHRIANEAEPIDAMNALSEGAIKGIRHAHIGHTHHAFEAITAVVDQTMKRGQGPLSDEERYLVLNCVQRLELIYKESVHEEVELLCTETINTLMKCALSVAQRDFNLVPLLCHPVPKMTDAADEEDLSEVSIKAVCALQMLGRHLPNEGNITTIYLREPYVSMIGHMEMISQAIFKKDKTFNLHILMKPFHELHELFREERFKGREDVVVILQHLTRVIQDFSALLEVVNQMEQEQRELDASVPVDATGNPNDLGATFDENEEDQ
jgi:hypothetical protein